jgi:hypothetical protein
VMMTHFASPRRSNEGGRTVGAGIVTKVIE